MSYQTAIFLIPVITIDPVVVSKYATYNNK